MLRKSACLAVALGLLISAQTTAAQQPSASVGSTSYKGFVAIGWQGLDLDEINRRLTTKSFPSLSEDVFSLGGGVWGIRNEFVLGVQGNALIGSEESALDGDFSTQFLGAFGQLDVGYRVYSSERLDVWPTVGLGAGAVTLEFVEQRSQTFDEVLDDPETSADLTADGFVLDLGVSADLRLTGLENADGPSRTRGLAVGVRAGYTHSPGDWDWKVGDVDVTSGPESGIRGFYVRLMVGAGWR